MLTSITPLGERGRANRWTVTAAAYLVASTLTGALVGVLLGGAGSLTAPRGVVALVALGIAAVLAGALDATGVRLPSWRRQVDENWLRAYRGWVYGAGYGAQLGVGVVTIVTSATVWLVLLTEWLAASPTAGVLIGAAFGLARGLPLLLVRSVDSPARLGALHRRVAGSALVVQRVAAGCAGAAGLVAVTVAAVTLGRAA